MAAPSIYSKKDPSNFEFVFTASGSEFVNDFEILTINEESTGTDQKPLKDLSENKKKLVRQFESKFKSLYIEGSKEKFDELDFQTLFSKFLYFTQTIDLATGTSSYKKITISTTIGLSIEDQNGFDSILNSANYQNPHNLKETSKRFLILWHELNHSQLEISEKKEKINKFFEELKLPHDPNENINKLANYFKDILIKFQKDDYINFDKSKEQSSMQSKELQEKLDLFLKLSSKYFKTTLNNQTLRAYMSTKLEYDMIKLKSIKPVSIVSTEKYKEEINDFFNQIKIEFDQDFNNSNEYIIAITDLLKSNKYMVVGSNIFETVASIEDLNSEKIKNMHEILKLINYLRIHVVTENEKIYNLFKLLTYSHLFFNFAKESEIERIFSAGEDYSTILRKSILDFANAYDKDEQLKERGQAFLKNPLPLFLYQNSCKQSLATLAEFKAIFGAFADSDHDLIGYLNDIEVSIVKLTLPPASMTDDLATMSPTLPTNIQRDNETPLPPRKIVKPRRTKVVPAPNIAVENQAPIPIKEISTNAGNTTSHSEALETLTKLLTKRTGNINSTAAAGKAFNNAVYHLNKQQVLMKQFLERVKDHNQAPFTKIEIAAFVLLMVLGSLALEQLLSAITLATTNASSKDHDLIKLVNKINQNTSKEQISFTEIEFLEGINRAEILSRDSFREARHPKVGVSTLLAHACLHFKGNGIDPIKLIKDTIDYFCKTQQTFYNLMRFFPQTTDFETLKGNFFSLLTRQLKEQCSQIRFESREQVNQDSPTDAYNFMKTMKAKVQGKSYRIKASYNNVEYLIAVVNTIYQTLPTKDSQEMGFALANIFYYTHVICEKFCYLLLNLKGTYPDEEQIGHDLGTLLSLLGLTSNLSAKELEFIAQHPHSYSSFRYDRENTARKVSKSHSKSLTPLVEQHSGVIKDAENAIEAMSTLLQKAAEKNLKKN